MYRISLFFQRSLFILFSAVILPISTLSTSDGWCWNRSSSTSLKSLIVSFPLLLQLDSATYVPKFPNGSFPMFISINPSSIPGNLVVVSRSGLKRIITGENCKFTVPFCRSVGSSSPFIQYYIMDNTSCSICDISFCCEIGVHYCFHSQCFIYCVSTAVAKPLQSSWVSGKWQRMTLMMLGRVRLFCT